MIIFPKPANHRRVFEYDEFQFAEISKSSRMMISDLFMKKVLNL